MLFIVQYLSNSKPLFHAFCLILIPSCLWWVGTAHTSYLYMGISINPLVKFWILIPHLQIFIPFSISFGIWYNIEFKFLCIFLSFWITIFPQTICQTWQHFSPLTCKAALVTYNILYGCVWGSLSGFSVMPHSSSLFPSADTSHSATSTLLKILTPDSSQTWHITSPSSYSFCLLVMFHSSILKVIANLLDLIFNQIFAVL